MFCPEISNSEFKQFKMGSKNEGVTKSWMQNDLKFWIVIGKSQLDYVPLHVWILGSLQVFYYFSFN